MKAVTGVGAPSYTSGAQLWKGTAEILKPKPVTTSTKATTRKPRASRPDSLARPAAMPE